jgi:hypothetical protein
MAKITTEKAKELGLPTTKGQVYSLNKLTGNIKLISSQEAYEYGLPVDEGQKWKINKKTGRVVKLNSKKLEKAKGGAVKKYSHGGSVHNGTGHALTYKR